MTTASPKPPRASDARRRILDASLALVAEAGVRAASFRDVARRAGVSHQTPYHHFKSEAGILRAIACEGFDALAKGMAEAVDAAGPDPVARLQAAGIAYVSFAHDHVGHFRVMFQSTLVSASEDAEVGDAIEGAYTQLVRLCGEVHAAGRARGLSVEALTHLAWSAVHGIAVLIGDGVLGEKLPDPEAQRRAAERVVTSLTALLEPPTAVRSPTRRRG